MGKAVLFWSAALWLAACSGADINDPYVHQYRSTAGEFEVQFWGHTEGNREQYDIAFFAVTSPMQYDAPLAAGLLGNQNYKGFSATLTVSTETISWPKAPPTAPTSPESAKLVGQSVTGKWKETEYYVEDRCDHCGGPVTLLPAGKMKLYDLELELSGPPARTLKLQAIARGKKKYE